MKTMRGFSRLIGGLVGLALLGAANTAQGTIIADNVVSFSGGSGFGVFDASGGSYGGASGAGVFDPLAVIALDGAMLALGGTSAAPGVIVLSFSTGNVVDGTGADIRAYDTIGGSEGIIVEASIDGISFFNLGTNTGLPSIGCTLAAPCIADFDLSGSGLAMASIFRLTVTDRVIFNFPQAYDLDALEALNFSTVAVPEPATLGLMFIGLIGMGLMMRRAPSFLCDRPASPTLGGWA